MAPRKRPGRGDSLVGTTYWSKTVRPRILRRDRYTCQVCHVLYGPARLDWLDVDHIVERRDGGTDDPRNLQAICKPCHAAKSARATMLRAEGRPVRPSRRREGPLGPVGIRGPLLVRGTMTVAK